MLMPDKDVLIRRGRKRWGLYESAVVSKIDGFTTALALSLSRLV